MPADVADRRIRLALGGVILMAAIIGGNTISSLDSDLLIGATLLLFTFALPIIDGGKVGRLSGLFAGALLLIVGVQMIPFGAIGLSVHARFPAGEFISLNVVETFRVFLTLVSVLIVFVVTLCLPYAEVRGLTRFLFLALFCNLLVASIQFSSRIDPLKDGLFGYPMNGGFFINQNHFSSFILVSVPFLFFAAIYQGRRVFAGITIGWLVMVLLAAGSAAGVGLGLLVVAVSGLALVERRRVSAVAVIVGGAILTALLLGADARFSAETGVSAQTRLHFAQTTLDGIAS